MREYVIMGSPDQVVAFRQSWLERAERIADRLGLPYRIAPASDPFFGRAARLIAASQVEQLLKFELLVPLRSPETADRLHELQLPPRSFRDDLGHCGEDGASVHTGCVAFGMDRLALALFAIHGVERGALAVNR